MIGEERGGGGVEPTPDWAGWLRRWEAQQSGYLPDREDRFTVITDAVATLGGQPVVLDLGCGPGSLARRLLDAVPGATVIGIDADPLLLAIGRGALGTSGGRLRWLSADLADPDWTARLGLDQPVDAAVSTTALHWLDADPLHRLYADVAALLRPGGLLLNGDHVDYPADQRRLAEVADRLDERRRDRYAGSGAEDWQSWWAAVEADPALAELTAERRRHWQPHPHHEHRPDLSRHLQALLDAGFAEAGVLWSRGNNRVLAGVR